MAQMPPIPEGFELVPDAPAALPSSAPPIPEGFELVTGDEVQTETYSGLPALNRGIARFVGVPVDLANAALSLVGLGSREPVGGSRSIERGLGALGVAVPEEGAQPTFGGRVLEEIGASVAALPLAPLMVGVRGAGAVAQSVRRLGQTVTARPVASTVAELGTAASAGLGAATAQEAFPDNPTAEVLGALAGGFGIPTAISFSNLPTRGARRVGASQLRGFTQKGAQDAASRRLKALAREGGDIDEAITRLASPDVDIRAGLTAAEVTGNRRLLSLERAVMRKNAELEGTFLARHEQANERLREAIEGLGRRGNPEATRAFIQERRDHLMAALSERAQRAASAAEQKIAKLGANATPEQQSQIVRQELRSAYDDALVQSDELWDMVPLDARVQSDRTRAAVQRTIDGLGRFQDISDLPKPLRQLVRVEEVKTPSGKTKTQIKPRVRVLETGKDLHLLRRDLLDVERRLSPDPTNRQALARVQDVQSAVLDDLSAARTGRGDLYDAALDFELTVDQKFRQGTVGRVLGVRRTGEPSVPDALTLQRVLGAGGPEAGVSVDEMLAAVDGAPQAVLNQVEDYLKTLFAQQTLRNGKVEPAAALRFLQRNNPILERFSALRAQLEDATQAQALATRHREAAENITKGLQNQKVSRVALYLEAQPGLELNAVARSNNPREAMRALKRIAARDPTGEASEGLKTAFLDMVTTGSGLGRFTDVEGLGVEFLGGNKMRRLLETKAVSTMAEELLTSAELNRLRKLVRTLERLEASAGRLPGLEHIIDPADTPITEYVIRTWGARLGAQFGAGTSGASLRTASIWSNYFGNKFNQLIEAISVRGPERVLIDAVQDRDLMLALLTRGDAPAAVRRMAVRKLNAWAIAELGVLVQDAEEEVPAQPERPKELDEVDG